MVPIWVKEYHGGETVWKKKIGISISVLLSECLGKWDFSSWHRIKPFRRRNLFIAEVVKEANRILWSLFPLLPVFWALWTNSVKHHREDLNIQVSGMFLERGGQVAIGVVCLLVMIQWGKGLVGAHPWWGRE